MEERSNPAALELSIDTAWKDWRAGQADKGVGAKEVQKVLTGTQASRVKGVFTDDLV